MIYRMGQRVTRSLVNHPVGFQLANYIRRALKAFSQSGELHLTTYQDHLRMWVDLSDFVGSTIYFYDFTPGDRGLIPFLKQHVRNTDVIIDVGAHIGMITLLAAYLAPQGSVHSFEASKDNFRLLQRNVDANDLPNVRLNHKALWHTSTTLDLFTKNSNNSGTFSLFKAEGWELEAHSIEAITLDSYVFSEDQPLARVDLIKIDIEGADLDALSGGLRVLETFRPKVIMEMSADNLNRSNHTAQEVIDFWSGLDYHMYQIADNGDVLEINNSDLLATPEDIDLYCVPREKSI